MDYSANLLLFFALVAGVVILPGLDMAFVVASALAGGRRAASAAVGGLVAGGACQVAIGATGTAVLLETAPWAFRLMLVAGALYVAWIGVGMWRGAAHAGSEEAVTRAPGPVKVTSTPRDAFRRAMVTNLLNPKAHLFMLAVFPQFVRVEYGPVARQAIVLGVIMAVTQASIYGVIGWTTAAARDRWARGPATAGRLSVMLRGVGALLVLTAIATLWSAFRMS